MHSTETGVSVPGKEQAPVQASLDAFCSEDHGVKQNRKIHKEASIPDVVEVVFNVFVDGGGAIGA